MQFGLQHPNFNFDYNGQGNDISYITDSLKNLVSKAENSGFDSFWVMDYFHQIQFVGRTEDPMLEGWTFTIYACRNNYKNKVRDTCNWYNIQISFSFSKNSLLA